MVHCRKVSRSARASGSASTETNGPSSTCARSGVWNDLGIVTPHVTAAPEDVTLIARAIATATARPEGLTTVQADMLGATADALTGVTVDYTKCEPLSRDDLADVLQGRDLAYRQRIVHHMVLGELVLRPIPTVVAHRVAQYAEAL